MGEMPWPAKIAHDLARTGEVGWKLRHFSAALCPRSIGDVGWSLDDLSSYSTEARPYVASITGLGDLPRVVAVAQDSPAARAGIRPDDLIVRIDGTPLNALPAPDGTAQTLTDTIAAHIGRIPEGTSTTVTIRRASRTLDVALQPTAVCSAAVVLIAKEAPDAYADRHNVAITAGLVESFQNDDELAFVLAHELAHVIRQDDSPKRRNTFKEEEQADVLGAELAFCSGYDPRRGADFLERYRKHRLFGWMASLSHHSLPYRAKKLRASPPPASCGDIKVGGES